MVDRERRHDAAQAMAALRNQLNADQLMTLRDLERFGWELKFVRRPPFQESVPVVIDGDRKNYAVLNPDGSLEDNPVDLKIRP
ncbi:hypothetical protein GCM10027432_13200 [Lysobacter fragariae]